MPVPPIAPAIKEAIDTFPYPIAARLKADVIEASSTREYAENLIKGSIFSLQYMSLIAASNYAASSIKDAKVWSRLERLLKPHHSDFRYFLQEATDSLRAHDSLFVPELLRSLRQAQKPISVVQMGHAGFEERPLGLLDALIKYRNDVAHDRFHGHWRTLAASAAILLERFLNSSSWCTRYPLLRFDDNGKLFRLMGPGPAFEDVKAAPAAQRELSSLRARYPTGGLLLADPSLSRILDLYPFLVWDDCPYCRQDFPTGPLKEVFLFNGVDGRQVIFSGTHHPRPDSAPLGRIEAFFADKRVIAQASGADQLTFEVIRGRTQRQCEGWLHQHQAAGTYIPQAYSPRGDMQTNFQGFLDGQRTGFLLLGESGMGKTSLLCNFAEELRGRGEAVVAYVGNQLVADQEIESRLLQDLHLSGPYDQLTDLLYREGRHLVVIVDGINEHEAAPALLRSICGFVARHVPAQADTPLLKVVVSCRTSSFDEIAESLLGIGGNEEALFPRRAFQTQIVEELGRRVETHRFRLDRLGLRETEVAYEAYRTLATHQASGSTEHRFRPRTSYSGLSLTARAALTQPWFLKLAVEVFDGRSVPTKLWTEELLGAYCAAKIFGRTLNEAKRFTGRTALIRELASLLRQRKSDSVARDDLYFVSQSWSQALLDQDDSKSAYRQLVEEEVLIEVPEFDPIGWDTATRFRVRFAFDKVLEYLLAQNIVLEAGGEQALTGDHLAEVLAESVEFDHLSDATVLLLTQAVRRGKDNLFVETLNASEISDSVPALVGVIRALFEGAFEGAHPLLTIVAERGDPEKAVVVLGQAGSELGRDKRHELGLSCLEYAERVCRSQELGLGDAWPHRFLNILIEKSSVLIDLGRLDEAISICDEVIGALEQPGHDLDAIETEHLQATALSNRGYAAVLQGRLSEALADLDQASLSLSVTSMDMKDRNSRQRAIVMLNYGMTLNEQRRYQEALQVHSEAIELLRTLTEADARADLLHALGGALNNKGNALLVLGRLIEADSWLQEAIAVYRRLVFSEGQGAMAHVLALALLNRSFVLDRLKRIQEGLAHADEGVQLLKRLVDDDGRMELESELAIALGNRGASNARAGRDLDAMVDLDAAIESLQRLATGASQLDLLPALARARGIQAMVLHRMGRVDDADASFDAAVETLQLLTEGGRSELEDEVANILWTRGMAKNQAGQVASALALFDRASAIYTSLLSQGDRPDITADLARTLVSRAEALEQLQQHDEAVAALDEAFQSWCEAVKQGASHLLPRLISTARRRVNVMNKLGRANESMAQVVEVLRIMGLLSEEWIVVEHADDGSVQVHVSMSLEFVLYDAAYVGTTGIESSSRPIAESVIAELGELLPAVVNALAALSPIERVRWYPELGSMGDAARIILHEA